MGKRANIVVVEDGAYEIYYCHWCADYVPAEVFWGPDQAVLFARNQIDARAAGPEIPMRRPDFSSSSLGKPKPGAEGWLDYAYAEGGALIDLDDRVLILFGGFDLGLDSHIPVRRLYLELLQVAWPGWQVRWAHHGLLEMADHVGLPRELVTIEFQPGLRSFDSAISRRSLRGIGSIRLEDRSLRLFALDSFVEWDLAAGPDLVDSMKAQPGHNHLQAGHEHIDFPQYGFHLDLSEHSVLYWTADRTQDPTTTIVPRWPGWRVKFLRDNYERHLDLLGDRVSLPSQDPGYLLGWAKGIAMKALIPKPSPTTTNMMLEQARRHGHDPSLSPAVRLDGRDLSLKDLRKEILDLVVEEWKQKRQQPT